MIKKNSCKISVIIPCYNEFKTINEILEKVISSIKNYKFYDYEIIVVDDCSTDGTKDKLKKYILDEKIKIIFHDANQGKGAAIKTAISKITGHLVIIQDADLEYDPYDYDKLFLPFFETNADIVYGSRFLGGGKYVRIHFFGII